MSYKRYVKYLESEHWKGLREAKFEEVGKRCQVCTKLSHIRVHHVNYRNLTDCVPSDLVVLCEPCHGDLHLALKLKGLESSDATDLFQMRHLILWVRTAPEYEKAKLKREAKKQRRIERGRMRAPYKKIAREVKRILMKNGGGCDRGIETAIEYLRSMLGKTAPF